MRAIRPLAAGYLLLGVAHIALLPPWEGFDEFAHYSYIQQVADTGSVPTMDTARISMDVEQYRRGMPLPYESRPPFERNGGLTYRTFFEGPPEAVSGGTALVHHRPAAARRYAPGPLPNWQAQHPPLYYFTLWPVYRATRHLSWGVHLFSLRLTSYMFAWAAWALALYGCLAAMSSRSGAGSDFSWPRAALGVAVWPMLLPAWFPEFARLGNDSLSALIATAVWFLTVRAVRAELSARQALALGVLLGAGALTKALFLPMAAGITGFWLVRAWTSAGQSAVRRTAAHLSLALAAMAAIAGWWYVRESQPYLFRLQPEEIAALEKAGGLAGGLLENFTLAAWLRGHAVLVTTVAWSGTWSLARPPQALLAPLALIVLLATAGYLSALRRFRLGDPAWLPAWMAAPLVAGLCYNVLLRIALSGQAITPGYYLHVLVAPLGCALGLAFQGCFLRRSCRKVALALAAYALAFALAVSWAQVLMFAGHLFKSGSNKLYRAASPWPALLNAPEVLHRLERLAFPVVGATAFALGGLLVLAGAVSAWKIASEEEPVLPRT